MLHTIWVYLGPFGCLTKLGAKRAELVQKFVTRSRVRMFRNERIRSTLLDRKLMFWRILYYFCVFGTIWLLYKTRCKMGRTSAKSSFPRSCVEINRNKRTRYIPLHPKLVFWRILKNLGAFRIFWLAYETRCKTSWTSAKVGNTSRAWIFCNEHTRFTPIGP